MIHREAMVSVALFWALLSHAKINGWPVNLTKGS